MKLFPFTKVVLTGSWPNFQILSINFDSNSYQSNVFMPKKNSKLKLISFNWKYNFVRLENFSSIFFSSFFFFIFIDRKLSGFICIVSQMQIAGAPHTLCYQLHFTSKRKFTMEIDRTESINDFFYAFFSNKIKKNCRRKCFF